jgi:hypothetical protein
MHYYAQAAILFADEAEKSCDILLIGRVAALNLNAHARFTLLQCLQSLLEALARILGGARTGRKNNARYTTLSNGLGSDEAEASKSARDKRNAELIL